MIQDLNDNLVFTLNNVLLKSTVLQKNEYNNKILRVCHILNAQKMEKNLIHNTKKVADCFCILLVIQRTSAD